MLPTDVAMAKAMFLNSTCAADPSVYLSLQANSVYVGVSEL